MAVGTFEQKISLEGAAEVRRQLEALGEAGKVALDSFNKSVASTQTPLNKFGDNVKRVIPDLNKFADAANLVSTSLGPLGQSAATAAGFLGSARGGLAAGAAAAAGAMILLAKNFSDTVINTTRMARALGLTTEELQGFQKAAKDAGIDQETLNAAITRFSGRVSAEAQDQFKALIDIAKQVSTRLAGGQITLIDAEQFRQLRDAASQAAPQIREIFRAAGDRRAILPLQQFNAEIEKLLRVSEPFRNLVRQIAIPAPALETFERFDVLLAKNSQTLASMGVKLLDANGNFRSTGEVLIETLDKLQQMPEGFQRTARSAQLFGRQAGPELAQALTRGGIEAAIQKLRDMGRVFDADLTQQALEARKAFNDFNATAGKTQNVLARLVLPSVTQFLRDLNKELSGENPIFTVEPGSFADQIRKGLQGSDELFNAFWEDFKNQGSQAAQSVAGFFLDAGRNIISFWQRIVELIRSARGEAISAPDGGGGGFASGGYTGGTGVRQIAGFVHGQEYVQPAHVVRQPGVRAFMEMLRRNGGDLQSVINRFARGFADGGFVDSINSSLSRNFRVPGYAGGGFVQAAGRSGGFTIAIGNERFDVNAPDETLARLEKAAMRRRLTSGGRKASHFA